MTLLDFARGPALHWALVIFVIGVVWRLVGTLFLLRGADLSAPRGHGGILGALRTILNRSWPKPQFRRQTTMMLALGYAFHIGLFIVILLFVPHIEFFKGLLGLNWPGVSNDIVLISAVIAIGAMIALLVRRLTHPVQKLISTADDYVSWVMTFLPLVTGLLANAHLGGRYETMLALHFLSVEAFLIWFPFGKLMHTFFVFPSRGQMGAKYGRRGVEI